MKRRNENNFVLKESYFDGYEYKGFRVKTKLAIEGDGEYEPRFLNSSRDVYDMFKDMRESDKERFYSILMDNKNKVIGVDLVSQGTLSESPVHPREVYKSALISSAASVIFVHCHPSGDPAPSIQDRELTMGLDEAGKLLGITVLDHVIIGNGRYFSFSEVGELPVKKDDKGDCG